MFALTARKTRAIALVLALGAVSLGGCVGSGSKASEQAIDALPNIGAGLKEDYKAELAEAGGESEQKAVVEKATRVNNVVGQELTFFDLIDSTERTLRLGTDGAVEISDKELSGKLSYATHWRVGDRTLDLCEDASCTYYSSWTIGVDDESASKLLYTFTLDTGGVESGEPVVWTFVAE